MCRSYGTVPGFTCHSDPLPLCFRAAHVVGPDSPVYQVADFDAKALYAAGPPYILTARDMYRVAFHWAKFLPPLFQLHSEFMAEMFAYCMAAAHLKLKHQLGQLFGAYSSSHSCHPIRHALTIFRFSFRNFGCVSERLGRRLSLVVKTSIEHS